MMNWRLFIVVGLSVFLYFYPSPIDPKPYSFPTPLPCLQGPLKVNTVLRQAKRLFEGILVGPESFAVDEHGMIYTGTADGKIFSINDRVLTFVAMTGINDTRCGTYDFEPLCGRPKGVKIGPDGKLYVADSYKGLLRVDTSTGALETLISNEKGSGGKPFKFLNSLDISKDGFVYFTDSSDKWERRNFRYEVLETHRAGRLIRYNIQTHEWITVLSDLYLPNGISLSSDQSYLIIAEMSVARIRRYYLKGEHAGTSDVFIDNLPGFPDNIKLNSRGNFYIGMGSVRFVGSSPIGSFLDLVAPYPAVKKFIATVTPFVAYNIFMPKHALAIEVSDSGTIVGSLHDPGAVNMGAVSEVFEHNNNLYIGHYQSPYLGLLNISLIVRD